MKREWKGAMIGGITGLVLFFSFDGPCLSNSFELRGQEQYLTANCFGSPAGGGCCPVSWAVFTIHLLIFIILPVLAGILIKFLLIPKKP
ncbi:MAG: hypothetical protein KKD18_06420 [Nanoarchaeota archaeon]|nr:hypothetical protein [Nanoarchaeota archaeon]MBU0978027.1 hypothetical protein [Nanoarchaeota archaeon]